MDCQILDNFQVDDTQLSVKIMIFIEFINDGIFALIAGEFELVATAFQHCTYVSLCFV